MNDMALSEKTNEALKAAMKAKDEAALRALRAIKSAILTAKTEKGGGGDLSKEQETALLNRLVKQRKESIKIYREQSRPDLYEAEEAELRVIEQFLPEQMSEDDVRQCVRKAMAATGATGPQDMGRVMATVLKETGGRVTGDVLAPIVKEELAK